MHDEFAQNAGSHLFSPCDLWNTERGYSDPSCRTRPLDARSTDDISARTLTGSHVESVMS